MGISRMTSIIESIPIRNNSDSPYGIFGETSSQKRARTMAESTRSAVLPCPAPSVATQPDPTTDFAFSQNRQYMPDRVNFVGESECGRVQTAQQALAQRRFALSRFSISRTSSSACETAVSIRR
jgi:hypothetical protein